jgi:alkylation response protein AidB-like acyl-CoA dehydrogenase
MKLLKSVLNKTSIKKSFFKYQTKNISLLCDPVGLSEDQVTIMDSSFNFAKNEFLPNAAEWDLNKHFPKDVYKKAAELGFGGIYVDEKYGGSGLGRLEASLIFEGLATGCVGSSAYLSIANMCAWIVDKYGSEEQKENWLSKMCSLEVNSVFNIVFLKLLFNRAWFR